MKPVFHTTFKATGTTWIVDVFDESLILNSDSERELDLAIKERVEVFEQTYSRFRADSVVGQMAIRDGKYIFPEDSAEMFHLYEEMYELSGGLVTPLIGQVLSDAGYDSKYSLNPKEKNKLSQGYAPCPQYSIWWK